MSETPPEPTEATEYDPSEHTVDDVVEYLGEHPEDAARVQAAETDGKARKGVLSWTAEEAEAAFSPEPVIQEGTEEYERVQVYP